MKSLGMRACYLYTVAAVLFFATACSGPRAGHELILAGSTSIQPFADKWAEHFMQLNPDVVVNVQGGGSSAGIQACRNGVCQIGMSSRELKPEEKDLREVVVARDGLAVIVHPSNPVVNLMLDEVQLVFAGQVRNWRFLGGPDREITVVTREEGSGTRGAFQEMVMKKTRIFNGAITQDSNGTVREIVARDPYSIGFISLGLVDDRVKAVSLEGVKPSETAILDGSYKLVRPFLFLTRSEPEGLVKRFMDFVLSAEGQELIKQEGLIPAR
jgi:phosphate transport system substrate-binding protein